MATLPDVMTTALGTQGLVVSRQGIGAMGMSHGYNQPKPEEEMIELLRYAISSGVTFIDTSDVYGPHTNEILVGKAIKGLRHKVQLATKFGVSILGNHSGMVIRGDPGYIRECLEGSLKRLNVDYIDLYYQHRIDPRVPIEVSIGVLKEFVEAGKVKYIGLSEACATDIRRAHAVHPITCIQIEYSLWNRDVEDDIIPTCRELGIGIVAYSPLGRGFFSGVFADRSVADLPAKDFRKMLPRLQQENMERNKVFYEKLVAIGKKKNCTPGQLALAWLQRQDDVVPIPGTTQRKNLDENAQSLAVHLSKEDIIELQNAVPREEVAGERYPDAVAKTTWKHVTTPPLAAWDHETQKLRPDWSQ